MQFTDLILKFLDRLGYSAESTILTTVTTASTNEDDDDYGYASTAVLVLGKTEERVIGIFLLADERDRRSTAAKSTELHHYANKFDSTVGQYIISHASGDRSMQESIEFYNCEPNGQVSKIDINDFPSYSEMWLSNTLGASKRRAVCENQRNNTLVAYAYFFALIFLALALGDIVVEKMLDMSYLNTQRTLLLIVSVLLLFVPGIVKKNCRT